MPPSRDIFRPHLPSPYEHKEPSNQGKARKKLASVIVRKLVKKTGDQNAKMGWNERMFEKHVVRKYGLEIVGHPRDKRFGSASSITGGNAQLELLAAMWEKDEIRFEAASAERVRAARQDPKKIYPAFEPGAGCRRPAALSASASASARTRRPACRMERAARDFETSFPPPPPRPAPKEALLHASTLRKRFEKGIGEAVAKGEWPRQGRSDQKGRRTERSKQWKKGRTGVKSAAWVLNSDDEAGEESMAVDDRIDRYNEVGDGDEEMSEISSSEDERD
ncbi:hypothetical protein C8Q80DRAFT_244128 [Daedaleopsis nitida]|nr:hypothetical protein C8Q80DRAFT_1291169 [Daedaleopsis nitida]KAI0738437.1 hypothetical protein C8Q80DRAFT_244128 [Daedaleopsis nitida]